MTTSMSAKRAQSHAGPRDLFAVTSHPHIRSYTSLETPAGVVTEGWVRKVGPAHTVELNGQEFLLFRGLSSEADVSSFAATYGLLGLHDAAREQVSVKTNLRPAWSRALSMPPVHYRPEAEPVADWVRQAGLMDTALGLWGIHGSPQARRALLSTCKRLGSTPEGDPLAHQAELAASSGSWPVRSVLGGAARAGLRPQVQTAWSRDLGESTVVEFRPSSWREYRRAGRVIHRVLRLELAPLGISELLVRLVNPWLERVPASLMLEEGRIIPTYVLPGDLLGILWIQFTNALLASADPRVCAWERCPGPPSRPGVFLWRWGRTQTGTKHRDARYCHPRCQHAAAVDRSRKSPGSLQRRPADP